MGNKKVEEELQKKNKLFHSPSHEANLKELWPLVTEHFEEPENIEIISPARTYKITFKDKRIIKCYFFNYSERDLLALVYEQCKLIPKPLKIIQRPNSTANWRFVEWVDGNCDRRTLRDAGVLAGIDDKYYYNWGKLIATIHNIVVDGEKSYITVSDLLWANYVMCDDYVVKMIDTKKFHIDHVPERFIFHFMIFNLAIPFEKKIKFIEGYTDTINGKREGVSLVEIQALKIFVGKLYEKLA